MEGTEGARSLRSGKLIGSRDVPVSADRETKRDGSIVGDDREFGFLERRVDDRRDIIKHKITLDTMADSDEEEVENETYDRIGEEGEDKEEEEVPEMVKELVQTTVKKSLESVHDMVRESMVSMHNLIKETREASRHDMIRESQENMVAIQDMVKETISHHIINQDRNTSGHKTPPAFTVSHSVSEQFPNGGNPPMTYPGGNPPMTYLGRNPPTGYPRGDPPRTQINRERRQPIHIKPPTYDGTTSLQDFLIQFEMASKLNDWSQEEKVLCLGCSLKGVAQEVLGDADGHRRQNYDELVQVLKERFGGQAQEEVFRAILSNRTQLPDESYPELAHAIRRLVKRTYPTAPFEMLDRMAREHFIDAIGRPDVREWVWFREPNSLDEAVRLSIKVEARKNHENMKGGNKRMGVRAINPNPADPKDQNSGSSSNDELKQTLAQICDNMNQMRMQMANMNRSNANKRPDYQNRLICYWCNEPGHKKWDCPKMKAQERERNHGNHRHTPRSDMPRHRNQLN